MTTSNPSQRALLRKVAQAAPVVLWALDVNGYCTLSMGRGLEAFGVSDHDLEGSYLPTVFDDPDAVSVFERAMAGESFRMDREFFGRQFVTWFEPLADADGTLIGSVAVSVDVTAEREREGLDLERAQDRATVLHYLLAADESDRRAVAQELHDDVIQLVTGLSIQVDLARGVRHDEGCSAASALDSDLAALDAAVEAAARRLRGLVGTLEPLAVGEADLSDALRSLARSSLEPLGIHVSVDAVEPGPPEVLARVCYRVVQEALTNVVRHARATMVNIVVDTDPGPSGRWRLTVTDDGVGAQHGYAERLGHRGLRGMRERVELAGGSIVISAAPGGGTRVFVELPADGIIAQPRTQPEVAASTTLARVLSAMSEGLAVFDRQWHVVFMNEAGRSFMGVPTSEWGDRTLWEILPVLGERPGRQLLLRAMDEQIETRFETQWGEKWLQIRAVPSVDGLVVLARDRTDWYEMQQRLIGQAAHRVTTLPDVARPEVHKTLTALIAQRRFSWCRLVTSLGVVLGVVLDEAGDPSQIPSGGLRMEATAGGGSVRLEAGLADTEQPGDRALLDFAAHVVSESSAAAGPGAAHWPL